MAMELLAPAGAMEALVAAVQNGADAVYLGGQALNARRGAGNFGPEELKRAVAYCHERGVRVHVTVNTLVMQRELSELCALAEQIGESGADAAIVQDFGVARVLRRMLPELALHASTQMAVHNRSGVRAARMMGFSRVVLAREMAFSEIAECAEEGVELEAFAHGALCVACSGQCLFSSMVGGRSGNRGMCAQPCRLPYRMEGAARREGYLLSPKDLMAIDQLEALRGAGVCSLKIEGRLKRPGYVAVVVRAYREALDAMEAGRSLPDAESHREALRQIFNRGGFTRGYGPGVEDAELMYDRQPNHAGVAVGEALRPGSVRLWRDVAAEDALCLQSDGGEQRPVKLSGRAGQAVCADGARPGDRLIRLTSARQMDEARRSMEGEHRARPVRMRARFAVGQPAELTATGGGGEARATAGCVEAARGPTTDAERVRAQLCRTGNTPWRAEHVDVELDGAAFVPASMANALRRDALDALTRRVLADARGCGPDVQSPPEEPEFREVEPSGRIIAESADVETLNRAWRGGADEVTWAPEDVRPEALERAAAELAAPRWSLAVPMTLPQPALDGLARFVRGHRSQIEAVYLSNAGHLAVDWGVEKRGDFGLNVANRHALAMLRAFGIDAYTPSVELNGAQIRDLDGRKMLIVHGRLPLMQLRHCPYLAGRPGVAHARCDRCDRCAPEARIDASALIDRKGMRFPLRRLATGAGCVVRVMNADRLMLLRRAGRLPGAWAHRVMLEAGEDAAGVIGLYRRALNGEDVRGDALFSRMDDGHTTTGHYFRGVE